jgi:hypothetical protein
MLKWVWLIEAWRRRLAHADQVKPKDKRLCRRRLKPSAAQADNKTFREAYENVPVPLSDAVILNGRYT